MEDSRRQSVLPDIDSSGEPDRSRQPHGFLSTNSEFKDRTLDILSNHDAKLRELAQQLHDEIGQLLVSSSMYLHSSLQPASSNPHLNTCLEIVQQAIERLRELASDLYPSILDHVPLPESLRCSLHDRGHRDGVVIELSTATHWVTAAQPIELTCYRAVMHLVDHAIVHRSSDRIRVDVRQDAETIDLTVCDLGRSAGSDSLRSSLDGSGCRGWHESCQRIEWLGGDWQIESSAGHGETIRIRLPITLDQRTEDSQESR